MKSFLFQHSKKLIIAIPTALYYLCKTSAKIRLQKLQSWIFCTLVHILYYLVYLFLLLRFSSEFLTDLLASSVSLMYLKTEMVLMLHFCQAQVQSPKVKTKRTWADPKITWATTSHHSPPHNF